MFKFGVFINVFIILLLMHMYFNISCNCLGCSTTASTGKYELCNAFTSQ